MGSSPPIVIDIEVDADAPRERVWALLADARGWSDWAAFGHSSLDREGAPDPDGVGAIRRFGTGPFNSREEVVGFDPPERLVYRLLSGLPVRDYEATVTLTEDPGGGTTIAWHSTFHQKLPGTGGFFRRFFTRFLTDTAQRLAAAS